MMRRSALLVCLSVAASCQNTGRESPVVASGPSEDAVLDLTASIAELERSVENLVAAVGAARAGHASEASFDLATQPDGAQAAQSVEALTSALSILERQRSVHSENIANEGVPGYRARRLDLAPVGEPLSANGATTPPFTTTMNQGVLELTGNQLDFGIEGLGFFEVMLPNGELRYTRRGTFRQDVTGRITTPEGYGLTDQIVIPPDCQGISTSADGQVFALLEGNELVAIGTLRVHMFAAPTRLESAGGCYFMAVGASGQAQARQPTVQGAGSIRQGYIERSNVDLTREMIDLQRLDRRVSALRHALATRGYVTR